tara:strand:- start:818 stop:1039 length:222 start_codon:yes stop_codon:yes gene_type:complete
VYEKHQANEITDIQMGVEQASNVFSTFGGIWGGAWGIGWEMGRLITQTQWYREDIKNQYVPPKVECKTCDIFK